jgi:L-lactate dehydrogenase complex protein LldG
MSARDDILRALRAAAPAASPLPDVPATFGVRYPDLRARFAQSMAEVGGRCVRVADDSALESALESIPEYAAAKKVVSLVPGVRRANVDLAAVDDPHLLRDVDFCVIPGALGVAENAAVWVTDHGGRNRAACFLTQHLAVVVRGDALVNNLHEAYARISIPSPGFSMFLSGPSKTADIEQALVIGAHGARSCTAILIG